MPSLPPLSLVFDLLLQVVLPALAVSAAVLLLFALPGKSWLAAPGAALALAAGIGVSNHFNQRLPWSPEEPVWHWLPAAALVALAVGLVARIPVLPMTVGFLLRAAACALAAYWLVPPELRTTKAWLQPVFLLVVLAEWEVLEASARQSPGGTVPLGLALVCAGGAIVLIQAAIARFGDISFMAGAALTGIAVVAWWKEVDTSPAMPGVAIWLPGLLLSGSYDTYSEVPWYCFALVGLAPLALVPALLPPLSWLKGVSLRLVQLALLLAPVIVAVVRALQVEPMGDDW